MRKFLVVDDNLAFAENLKEIIADADVGEAVLAESGSRALVLAGDTRFDALLSDVRMPNMSGVELVRRLRLLDPGLPAVLVTAYTSAAELLSALQQGILCVLPKPVPIARLLALLAHARRDGVVALVGPETALRDSLAETMRSDGFTPVIARSLAEAATLVALPLATVVDIRTLSVVDSDALLRMATVPRQPILAAITELQRSQRVLSSEVFTAWSDPARLMSELRGLCDRGHGPF